MKKHFWHPIGFECLSRVRKIWTFFRFFLKYIHDSSMWIDTNFLKQDFRPLSSSVVPLLSLKVETCRITTMYDEVVCLGTVCDCFIELELVYVPRCGIVSFESVLGFRNNKVALSVDYLRCKFVFHFD